jgi:DNA-binding HxlR family transcriptional regulator
MFAKRMEIRRCFTAHRDHAAVLGYSITALGRPLSPVFAVPAIYTADNLAQVKAAREDYDSADKPRPS